MNFTKQNDMLSHAIFAESINKIDVDLYGHVDSHDINETSFVQDMKEHHCKYCHSISNEKDMRGNCIACGAPFGEPNANN